jgi:hypothetical protein
MGTSLYLSGDYLSFFSRQALHKQLSAAIDVAKALQGTPF